MGSLRLAAAVTLAALGVLTITPAAMAQAWPNKSVRVVIPFPAGGSADTLARLLGQKLTERLGQPFLADNRPGAGGNIGTELVAKAAPDGYTFLMGVSSIAIAPSLYANLNWDPVKDLAPVVLVASTPNILVVHPSVAASSVQELVALAKSKPGQLNYASGGNGATNHLAGELFKRMTGTEIVHIPYRGNPLAVIDVLNGQVAMMFDFMITSLPHVKAGKLRPLAVTGTQRSAQVPELPTVSEAGVTGYEASTWFAVMAPAGTPAEAIGKLNAEVNAVLRLPDVRERLDTLGAEPLGGTSADVATRLHADLIKWTEVVKAANIKIE
ncbi:MAG: tripartite tricarboxylate transporter substrate binding protein [Alphaproteobacteria bacterium]|nr:tripartite tricarboxylate transporter substrate binding protein [Alphaproteobacteria bacterium]